MYIHVHVVLLAYILLDIFFVNGALFIGTFVLFKMVTLDSAS